MNSLNGYSHHHSCSSVPLLNRQCAVILHAILKNHCELLSRDDYMMFLGEVFKTYNGYVAFVYLNLKELLTS